MSNVPTSRSLRLHHPESEMSSQQESYPSDIHLQSQSARISIPGTRYSNQTGTGRIRNDRREFGTCTSIPYQEGAAAPPYQVPPNDPSHSEIQGDPEFDAVFRELSISPTLAWGDPTQETPLAHTLRNNPIPTPVEQTVTDSLRSAARPLREQTHQQTPRTPINRNTAAVTPRQSASIDVSGYRNAKTVKWYFAKKAKNAGADIVDFVEDDRKRKINITFTDGNGK